MNDYLYKGFYQSGQRLANAMKIGERIKMKQKFIFSRVLCVTSFFWLGFILFVMLGLPFEASATIPHFKEGSIAIIKKNEKDLFDFSQD